MVALILSATIVAQAAMPSSVARWQPQIEEASHRFGVPSDWIARVMTAESHGRTIWNGLPIRSPAGAMGLMQLMPGTWSDLRSSVGLGRNPDDPGDNILAGTAYLRLLYDRFGYPGLFAAYHAGPGRYADYLAGRATLPETTRIYLRALTGTVQAPAKMRIEPLFVVRHDAGDRSASPVDRAMQASLFAIGAGRP